MIAATELSARLKRVRLLSLDVDGVLTDGGIYFTDAGDELRKFNVKDGLGIQRAQKAGVIVVMVTSSVSPAIGHRGKALGVDHIFLDTRDKLDRIVRLCDALKIDLEEVAHVGDDLVDLALFGAVGCPLTVSDAVEDVKAKALYVATKKGGEGAVREICDLLVAAKQER
jgi:3-deoxy-D-manno-octulosonate 8-phosphate phosphatase (KDO 8-P phosphatase)